MSMGKEPRQWVRFSAYGTGRPLLIKFVRQTGSAVKFSRWFRWDREIDSLPETEKTAIRSTFVTGENPQAFWESLINLTALVYKELEGHDVPVTQEMLHEYYKGLR